MSDELRYSLIFAGAIWVVTFLFVTLMGGL